MDTDAEMNTDIDVKAKKEKNLDVDTNTEINTSLNQYMNGVRLVLPGCQLHNSILPARNAKSLGTV